jgi:hypothetical protein
MKKFLFILALYLPTVALGQNNLETRFEKSNGLETGTYQEVMAYYEQLATDYPEVNIEAVGHTDSGHPLHLVTVSTDQKFDFGKAHQAGKAVILINNGIHPGEADGIEASMMLARNYINDVKKRPLLDNVVLAIVPIYNIGGALNRNSHSRTNQIGPKEYGFRGNAQNLDLNRDFIKMDSKNAFAFAEIYHKVKPDIIIDTHVSNGADYQYNITHLATQPDKLGGALGSYLKNEMIPKLEVGMHELKDQIIPFVNVYNKSPDVDGYVQFMDSPRYSSGYTALFHSLGFTIETHMLKPFDTRVKATYSFLETIIKIMSTDHTKIKQMRNERLTNNLVGKRHPINWRLDRSASRMLNFRGYVAETTNSSVTGKERLLYNREKPYSKPIPYYNHYVPRKSVVAPAYYVIPQGWHKVIDRLKINSVEMTELQSDSIMIVQAYKIVKFNTAKNPYEGHYSHTGTEVESAEKTMAFLKGDVIVPVNQSAGRFVVEVLEPQAVDSYFNWNFFDTILQQKEYFSPYVFENIAAKLLEEDDELRQEFEAKKKINPEFANNWYAQLEFIYRHSAHYEKEHMQYPVFRIMK